MKQDRFLAKFLIAVVNNLRGPKLVHDCSFDKYEIIVVSCEMTVSLDC